MAQYDFHFHSTYSDGSTTLQEIFNKAKGKGIKALAVTDHDTSLNFPEMKILSKAYGIAYIPALELTVVEQGVKLHVLAYGLNKESEELYAYSTNLKNYLDHKSHKQISILNSKGINISPEEFFKQSKGGPLYRAKLLYTLALHGYLKVDDIMVSLPKYFGKDGMCYVEDTYNFMNFKEGCKFIKRNGGKVVLAHPGKIKKKKEELYNDLIRSSYLDGIEVYHTDNDEEVKKELRDICLKKDLRITGGSDSHGIFRKKFIDIGDMELPQEVVESLKDLFATVM
ncbi:hypothetical protein SAMN05444401_2539 [Clostridium amylolyticum]|uniref:Polymerase/histidinol phosphatase N-terminal domain-containing protein n=1 Tax=Clostridium amylolyticum TaxID=1121298 RepID=A0A1M6HJ34_9CLOT|nr:PHP domain-containing protein [Clostridium amylolyticum]SHJ22216.1 hypothetical protein SAMN05444401_2539 [Clostridium amylolyticum]